MPEPTDPEQRLGGEAPPDAVTEPADAPEPAAGGGGPPRHWLEYVKGRAPHLFTADGDFGAGWWSHSAARVRVAPIAPPRSEPRVHEQFVTAPGEDRGPPPARERPERERPERERPVTPRVDESRDRLAEAERPARSKAPRTTRTTRAKVMSNRPVAKEPSVSPEPPRAARAPRLTPAALRAAIQSRPTFEFAVPRSSATVSDSAQAAARVRRPQLKTASETTHDAAPPRRPAAMTAFPPFPLDVVARTAERATHPAELAARPIALAVPRDQWPSLPVAPIARVRSRATSDVERVRSREPRVREDVVDVHDLWPSLPSAELAEPEPWRDLDRERVRDARIAREQVGR